MAPELKDAIAKVCNAAKKAGKKSGIFSTDGGQAKMFADQGIDMISVSTDYTALEYIMKQQLSLAMGTAEPSRGGTY
jgi:4-hydroxy-2-oxoheptanedioate aldolase